MSLFTSIVNDLRERRLWPVVLVLAVALVAVPVLLAKPASTPATPAPAPATTTTAAGEPVISVSSNPTGSPVKGRARDPFAQQKASSRAAVTTATMPGSTAGITGSGGSTGFTGTGTGSTGSGSSSSTTTTTTSTTTSGSSTPAPQPTPVALAPTESYHVQLQLTTASGGLDTIDPLRRLSLLPSSSNPLLIELGVLQGGSRVLFVVQPGAVLIGPGTCIPGPTDCELLSLQENQTESVARQTATGTTAPTQFQVTSISVDKHPTVAAALAARKEAVAAGRTLLGRSTLPVLSLFQYKLSAGAVVDLRTVTAGGS